MNPKFVKIVDANFQSEDRTLSYYDWRASGYDKATSYEIAHHQEAIQLADIQPEDRILEVACGTGRATVELAGRLGKAGKLYALDLSETMQATARKKITERGLLDRVEFRVGNARNLDYPDRTFDILYNSYMFDLIPASQFLSVLKEFKRVLKPGGKMILVNMSKNTHRKTFYEWVYQIAHAFPCRPVVMESFVQAVGLSSVKRIYRASYFHSIPLPFGTEIVTACKPLENL